MNAIVIVLTVVILLYVLSLNFNVDVTEGMASYLKMDKQQEPVSCGIQHHPIGVSHCSHDRYKQHLESLSDPHPDTKPCSFHIEQQSAAWFTPYEGSTDDLAWHTSSPSTILKCNKLSCL